MVERTPDFSGWATKTGLKCSDGRTIMKDAFAHQFEQEPDGKMTVPLVWSHGHGSPKNVLGHAVLEPRDEGVYAYGYFNDSEWGEGSKTLVRHGDVTWLSIYANQLIERSKQVFHGAIREVSLVLAGANPGAKIENVLIAHSDDPNDVTELTDAVTITTGLAIEHSAVEEKVDEPKEPEVQHAEKTASSEDETAEEIYNGFSDKQKQVVHYMIGEAIEANASSAEHSATNQEKAEDGAASKEETLTHQEGTKMTNVFDQNAAPEAAEAGPQRSVLTHDQLTSIVNIAKKNGGMFKEALLAHAEEYGITDIELLFPDARNITQTPQFISRRMEWVASVLDGVKHSPFANVKTLLADITEPEARAKGYIKGTRKKEEVFKLLRRTTRPATIYKKQKLDRDDMLDITDVDVVNWLKAEMRLMIEEELARAILVGDGRSDASEDKVKDPEGATDGVGIRSILHDDDLYSIKRELAANVSPKDAVKGLVRARSKYRGSGKPTLYVSDAYLTDIMLEEDKFGRPLYATEDALADKLRVKEIVTVDLFEEYPSLFAIMVSLQDYQVGSNKGGELTSFEDFDIDFNQHKYLQETRLSGGLTKPFSAVVVFRGVGTLATAQAPSFDGATNTITIPTVTGVVYTINDEPVEDDVVIDQVTEVEAQAANGYYLAPNTTDSWSYTP